MTLARPTQDLVMPESRRTALVTAAVPALAAVLLVLEARSGNRFYDGWWVPGLVASLLLVHRGAARWVALGAALVVLPPAFTLSGLLPSFGVAAAWTLVLVLPALAAVVLLDDGAGRVRADTQAEQRRFEVVWLACAGVTGLAVFGLRTLVDPMPDAARHGVSTFLLVASSLAVALPLHLPRDRLAPLSGRLERAVLDAATLGLASLLLFLPVSTVVAFLMLPHLGWLAVQTRRHEAMRMLAAIALFVYTGTLVGFGPLGDELIVRDAGQRSLLLYGFLMACATVAFPVASMVHRLKTSTAQARRSQATVDQLMGSSMSTCIVATDAEGRIQRLNDGGAALLGYSADEVIGWDPRDLHQPGEIERQAELMGCEPAYPAVIAAQVASGTGHEWELRARDGSRVVLRLTITPLLDDETCELVGFFCIGDDVTERIRTQEALGKALAHERASVAHLLEADRVKQELVSNVSHELRTPITSIAGYAEMLGEGVLGELGKHQSNAVDRIARNSARLLDLVEDLLTLSRAEAGTLDLDLATVALGDVVAEAIDMVRPQLASRDLDLVVEDPGPDCVAWGDRRALERVLLNLLTNAVKFTPDGGSVRVAARRRAETCVLTVSDTGMGIAEEEQHRLFDRFFRTSTASTSAVPGTGLGLSIVEAIVRAHGGSVEVSSSPGEGTTFDVSLPVPSAAAERASRPAGAA